MHRKLNLLGCMCDSIYLCIKLDMKNIFSSNIIIHIIVIFFKQPNSLLLRKSKRLEIIELTFLN